MRLNILTLDQNLIQQLDHTIYAHLIQGAGMLYHAFYTEYKLNAPDLDDCMYSLDSQLRKDAMRLVIAIVEDTVAGIAKLNHDDGGEYYKFGLAYVAPEYRNQGIFRLLDEEITLTAQTWGKAERIIAFPLETTERYFEKKGYQPNEQEGYVFLPIERR